MKKDTEWYKRMLEHYGSEEAISAIMSKAGREGAEKRKAKGGKWVSGVTKADKATRSEWGKQGADKRWQKH